MNIQMMYLIETVTWMLMRLGLLSARRVLVTSSVRSRRRAQSATEYIIFLGTVSALVVFAAPFFVDMRQTANETFRCATLRILSDGRWMSNQSLPHPCD